MCDYFKFIKKLGVSKLNFIVLRTSYFIVLFVAVFWLYTFPFF
jgi:hypothetical protein